MSNRKKLPQYEAKETASQKMRNLYESVGSQSPYTTQNSATQNSQLNSQMLENDDEELIGSSQLPFSTPKTKRSFKNMAQRNVLTPLAPITTDSERTANESLSQSQSGKNENVENLSPNSQTSTTTMNPDHQGELNNRYVFCILARNYLHDTFHKGMI